MMETEHVQCPGCGSLLAIPPGRSGCKVRCGQCHHRFCLPARVKITDDTVASWLEADGEPDLDFDETPLAPDSAATTVGVPVAHLGTHGGGAVPSQGSEPPTHMPVTSPTATKGVRLIRIDREGALLEFPAAQLEETRFRGAMPRVCMQCGGRTHLEPHVIVFAATLVDSISLEAEHLAGKMVLTSGEARHLSWEELLGHLPLVPNVPAPANLPMPYWLCDMCSTARTISGQIKVHSETGEGYCRLLIRNLRRAADLLSAMGARGTPAHNQLLERIAKTAEKPWDSLPLTVQHRIRQWYQPASDESFVAYIPDRGRTRTEDGMAGLIVSSRRLIYHTRMRHHDLEVSLPVQFRLALSKTDVEIGIKTATWEAKHLRSDKVGVAHLRRALVKGKFRATWR